MNGIQFTQKGYYFSAPPSLGSYGFTDTYTDQGIMQLQMLLSHMQHQDEIAKLIMIFLENLILITGIRTLPFSQSLMAYLKYVEKTWIMSIWEFIYHIRGQIHIEDIG